MTPNSSPVGREQERSLNVPEAHAYERNKIIPQLLSRMQKSETLVIPLMSERFSKIGVNIEQSHLASN